MAGTGAIDTGPAISRLVTRASASASADKVAALLIELSKLNGTNPFTFLRETGVPQLVAVPDEPWVAPMIDVLHGIYGLMAVAIIIGLFVRWRSKNLSFIKRTVLPGGSLITVNPTSCFFAVTAVYAIVGQVGLWCTRQLLHLQAHPDESSVRSGTNYVLGIYIYIVLMWSSWGEACGVIASCITTHFRVDGHLPRYVSAIGIRWINCFIVAWPTAITVAWIGLFIGEAVRIHSLDNTYNALFEAISVLEAQWKPGAPYIPGLLSLQPMLTLLGAEYQKVLNVLIGALYMIAGHIIVLILLWIPASVIQIRMLLHQIRFLQETKKSATEAGQTTSHFGLLSKLTMRSKREAPDPEKQTKRLQNLCWQRIVVSIVFMFAALPFLVVSLMAAIGLTISINLSTPANIFTQIGVHMSAAFVLSPLAVWYLVRSFDKTAIRSHPSDPLHSETVMSNASMQSPPRSPPRTQSKSFFAMHSLLSKDRNEPTSTPRIEIRVERDQAVHVDSYDDEEK